VTTLPGAEPAEFGVMRRGALLADGSAVVGDDSNLRLVYIGADGRVAGQFGRKGSGPGEMRYITVLVTRAPAGVELLDNILGRRTVLGVIGDSLALQETGAWAPYREAEVCQWEDGFIGLHYEAESGTILHHLARDGEILSSFGSRLFEGTHKWNLVLTTGSLLCVPQVDRVIYAGILGHLAAYSIKDGVVWQGRVSDFYPIEVKEVKGGIDFIWAPPPRNMALAPMGIVQLDEAHFLLQLRRQERSIVDGKVVVDVDAAIDSRIIRIADGVEVGRQSDLPRILALRDGRALLVGMEPEPWVEVRALSLTRLQ